MPVLCPDPRRRPTITADIAFQQAANAAFVQWQNRPKYVSYETHTRLEVPSMKKVRDVDRKVVTRSVDDAAVLQDLPQGENRLDRSFPISPTFDALSYFKLQTYIGWHQKIETHVDYLYEPLHFTIREDSGGSDVVVSALRNYYPRFAPDSTDKAIHLDMRALPTLTTGNSSDFYISDVKIDGASMLPTQITYTGRDDRRFVVDYQVVNTVWVVRHAFFEQTVFAPLKIGRVHYTADASFENYAFSADSPDKRL